MPDDYRISDLSTAPSIGNSDLMELSVVNTASETGYTSMKAPVLNLANKIVNATQYVSDLQTQNKTITGAINEIAQGGGGGGGDADIVKTASGNPCSFSTSYAGALKSLTADIVCGGGGGTPSTPIPLVGHSELNLTRCGVNLFDDAYVDNNLTAEQILPAGTYYIKAFVTGSSEENRRFSFYFNDTWNVISSEGAFDNGGITWSGSTFGWLYGDASATVTLTHAYKIRASVLVNTHLTRRYAIYDDNSITQFIDYNGQTFTVAFGQTVYGGVYDKSGRLTIDTVKVVLNGTQPIGMTNWQPNTNTRAWIYLLATFPDLKDYEITDLNISSCKLKADKLQTVTYQETNGISSNDIPSISIVGGDYWSIAVRVNDTTLENDTAINNYLSQNPIEVCYELATPIVIDVPSISVFAENGVNNIVSDGGGDVSVEYYTDLAEDIKDFIGDGVEVGDLANVEITTPSNNQVLKYDATSQKWVNGTGGGGASDLDDLGDVEITTPSNDQVLKYDSASQKWVNGNSSGGSAHNYSTTEQVVGTWIDGSSIYEKTIYNAGGASGTITIPHNITNMSKCIDLFGTCHDIGYGSQHDGEADMPLPRIATDGYNVGIAGVNTTNIIIAVDSIWGDRIQDFYITLRYTKST